jgi:hypothetical protein
MATSRVAQSMTTPAVCPYCGQALVDRKALQHLHGAEEADKKAQQEQVEVMARAQAELIAARKFKALQRQATEEVAEAVEEQQRQVKEMKALLATRQREEQKRVVEAVAKEKTQLAKRSVSGSRASTPSAICSSSR